jgi:hypothetical protein
MGIFSEELRAYEAAGTEETYYQEYGEGVGEV